MQDKCRQRTTTEYLGYPDTMKPTSVRLAAVETLFEYGTNVIFITSYNFLKRVLSCNHRR